MYVHALDVFVFWIPEQSQYANVCKTESLAKEKVSTKVNIQVSPAKRKSESSQQANKRKGACSCRFLINKSQSSCKAPILQVKMLVLVGVMKYSTHCLPLG